MLPHALRNNVAASSAFYGFWYDAPEEVLFVALGDGNFTAMCPSHTPLLEFSNNVAFGNKRYGPHWFIMGLQ